MLKNLSRAMRHVLAIITSTETTKSVALVARPWRPELLGPSDRCRPKADPRAIGNRIFDVKLGDGEAVGCILLLTACC